MNPTRSTAIDRSIVTRRVRPMTSSNDDAEWRRLGTTRTRRMSDPKPKPPFPIYLCPLPLLSTTRARPRTTINNFTPNHARAHGVQVNASMGGLSACVRDVVVVFRRSGRPRRTVRRGYPGRATMMAFSSTMSTVRVHATRRAHGWAYFRSRRWVRSRARGDVGVARMDGWMDGWMDGMAFGV